MIRVSNSSLHVACSGAASVASRVAVATPCSLVSTLSETFTSSAAFPRATNTKAAANDKARPLIRMRNHSLDHINELRIILTGSLTILWSPFPISDTQCQQLEIRINRYDRTTIANATATTVSARTTGTAVRHCLSGHRPNAAQRKNDERLMVPCPAHPPPYPPKSLWIAPSESWCNSRKNMRQLQRRAVGLNWSC